MRSRDKQSNLLTRFMLTRYKLRYNDDEVALNYMSVYTKSYHPGTEKLCGRAHKLGAHINIETGYEDKKLE